jgi:hypothetical protein
VRAVRLIRKTCSLNDTFERVEIAVRHEMRTAADFEHVPVGRLEHPRGGSLDAAPGQVHLEPDAVEGDTRAKSSIADFVKTNSARSRSKACDFVSPFGMALAALKAEARIKSRRFSASPRTALCRLHRLRLTRTTTRKCLDGTGRSLRLGAKERRPRSAGDAGMHDP